MWGTHDCLGIPETFPSSGEDAQERREQQEQEGRWEASPLIGEIVTGKESSKSCRSMGKRTLVLVVGM